MSASAKTPIETLQTAWKAYLDTKLVKAILAYDAAMKLSDDSAKEAAVIAGIASDKLRQFANVPQTPETQEQRRTRLKAVAVEPSAVSVIKTA